MPQEGQIMLEYNHPYVKTVINDNTVYTPSVSNNVDIVRALYVFPSNKGQDGVITTQNNLQEFLKEYGNPDFNKFGQAPYMPYGCLLGGGTCYCMRIVAEDAKPANVIISAEVKWDSASDGKLQIRYVADSVELASEDEISTKVQTLLKETPEDGGYAKFPLIAVYFKGKGTYGNNYSVRINSDKVTNKKRTAFRNYSLELISNEASSVTETRVTGLSLNQDAIYNNTSYFIDDVINLNSGLKIKTSVDYAMIEKYIAYLNNVAGTGTNHTFTIDDDILFGLDASGKAIDKVTIEAGSTENNTFDLNGLTGIPFGSGSNGKFDSTDPTERSKAINQAYIDAFSGKTNKGVRSKNRYPIQFLFDANFDMTVKTALVELATKRGDCECYIDAGIHYDVDSVIAWNDSEAVQAINNFAVHKEMAHYSIMDPFTGRKIPMTITYFYSYAMPSHLSNNNLNIPFVGERYSKLTGHIKNSLYPLIDCDEEDVKEKLYERNLNYYEAIAENTFVRGTQQTSQNVISDLSEEHNVRVLLAMKRELETMTRSNCYDFAEPDDRKLYTEAADRKLEKYKNYCRSASVEFTMNPYEEEQEIIHCYLAVIFKTINKRGIVEIDINPRV